MWDRESFLDGKFDTCEMGLLLGCVCARVFRVFQRRDVFYSSGNDFNLLFSDNIPGASGYRWRQRSSCLLVFGFAVRIFVNYRGLSFTLGWGIVFFWDFARRTRFGDITCWWLG